MSAKMRLAVHYFDGSYYATITAVGDRKPKFPCKEVFSIERDIALMEIEDLRKEGQLEARKLGIFHVINLD